VLLTYSFIAKIVHIFIVSSILLLVSVVSAKFMTFCDAKRYVKSRITAILAATDNFAIFLAHSTLGRSTLHAILDSRSPIPFAGKQSLDFRNLTILPIEYLDAI